MFQTTNQLSYLSSLISSPCDLESKASRQVLGARFSIAPFCTACATCKCCPNRGPVGKDRNSQCLRCARSQGFTTGFQSIGAPIPKMSK